MGETLHELQYPSPLPTTTTTPAPPIEKFPVMSPRHADPINQKTETETRDIDGVLTSHTVVYVRTKSGSVPPWNTHSWTT